MFLGEITNAQEEALTEHHVVSRLLLDRTVDASNVGTEYLHDSAHLLWQITAVADLVEVAFLSNENYIQGWRTSFISTTTTCTDLNSSSEELHLKLSHGNYC